MTSPPVRNEVRRLMRLRENAKQWHTGPFPRPTIGPPSHPRPPRK